MKHISEPIPKLPGELGHVQPLIERMMAKERDRRVASETEWRKLITPLLKPFKLPRVSRENFAGLPSAKEREKTRLSIDGGKGDPGGTSRAGRPRPRPKPNRRRLFLLNLLLVLAVVAWTFFNYQRIPGMFLSLWREIVGWVSSLLSKI